MTTAETSLAVGVDFGGTKILGVLVDAQGNIVAEHRVPTPHDGEELLDAIAALVKFLEAKVGPSAVGLGIGAAGLVNRSGVLPYAPNLPLADFDIKAGMEKRLEGQSVHVDNDGTCAAWGECLLGAGRRGREVTVIALGTGIGGGIVSNGQILRGHNGFAPEVGHMTVVANGARCGCGKLGCWEAYASGSALGRLGREAAGAGKLVRGLELTGGNVEVLRGEHVTASARLGDAQALAVMDEFAWWFACGLASLIALFDPEIIVVGGGLVKEADLYLDATKRHLQPIIFGGAHRPEVPFALATLGVAAAAIGAAMMVHTDTISPE